MGKIPTLKSAALKRSRSPGTQIVTGLTLALVLFSVLLWFIPRLGHAAAMPADCGKFAFSTEEDFVTQGPTPPDGNPIISDGDLLGPNCEICARNSGLLSGFDVNLDVNLGLDAADVVDADASLVAFSTELDSPNAGQFTAGDLLVTNGVILPNVALTFLFDPGYDIGLDAVHFVGEKSKIVDFLKEADTHDRDYWVQNPGNLAPMLGRYSVDIWFSTEGTAPTVASPAFLDGDLLSAANGTIVAPNSGLLPADVPAGIPTRGVDFGLDAATSGRSVDRSDLEFSTEIPYQGEATAFGEGDVLEYGTGKVLKANGDLIVCLEPKTTELGLDALHTAPQLIEKPTFLPLILRKFGIVQ